MMNMANTSRPSTFNLSLIISLIFLALHTNKLAVAEDPNYCSNNSYSHFFAFGDSNTDNGNYIHYATAHSHVANPPYGETFFNRPTGRYSDGRIIIDFISEALNMPFLTPFLAGNSARDFQSGANFAVAGARALDPSYFEKRGLSVFTPYSLRAQIRGFEEVLGLLGSSEAERRKVASTSLFLLGLIGGNDYNHALLQNAPFEEVKTFLPDVINALREAATTLIQLGAKTIVISGTFPNGCIPKFLVSFGTSNALEYDRYGCLRWANEFAQQHNSALKTMMHQLSTLNPGVNLIYADYYGVMLNFVQNPTKYGFEDVLDACCGDGTGPHNMDLMTDCGLDGTFSCPDPNAFVSWDGIHLTEKAYSYLSHYVLNLLEKKKDSSHSSSGPTQTQMQMQMASISPA